MIMSEAIDRETLSDRGFHHWGPIAPVAGTNDGTDDVRLYESSGAAAIRGDITIPGPFAWLSVGGKTAHLTRSEVLTLRACIDRWLLLNPGQGDIESEDQR